MLISIQIIDDNIDANNLREQVRRNMEIMQDLTARLARNIEEYTRLILELGIVSIINLSLRYIPG